MSVSAPERPRSMDSKLSAKSSKAEAEAARQLEMREAEEWLFSGPPKEGFAKSLYQGQFRAHAVFPYPALPEPRRVEAFEAAKSVRGFLRDRVDATAIDREADIPRSVISGLGQLGVLGMTAPLEHGGKGLSQSAYCRVMEEIGGHCASTAVFVNAHHSIGIRALLLFGTEEQKAKWLPGLVTGEKIAAFALTEPEAGSDAANVQTTAMPSADGKTYRLNGQKRYITNGAISDVLTVMARTPDPTSKTNGSKITAFLVTPDMPGFQILEERKPKCGIRGTATGALQFNDMEVSASNILGPLGKGLRVALTVLDFGRTTFGASCTGAAKTCFEAAVKHANKRRQFNRTLGQIDLVRKKIALMAARIYAMEATTYVTAAMIDSGAEDYMLETAILKVFTTEVLWETVYETLQIHGGQGYFNDEPFERMMRDARINTIGEGANEVLKSFIALVGMRDMGTGFESTLNGLKNPKTFAPTLWKFAGQQIKLVKRPQVPVQSQELRAWAKALSVRIRRFSWTIETVLMSYREAILDRQLPQEKIANAAIALYTWSAVLSRLDAEIQDGSITELNRQAADLYLRMAKREFDRSIAALAHRGDDQRILRVAELALRTNSL